MMRRVTLVLITITLLLLGYGVVGQLHAQTTAEITGTITDTQGAVVPDISVAVSSVDTGITQTAKTNSLGVYTVPLLKPGSYRMDINATGFRAISRTGIILQVAQTATLNFQLQVGQSVETVTVSEFKRSNGFGAWRCFHAADNG
jgi:hypothetical protein